MKALKVLLLPVLLLLLVGAVQVQKQDIEKEKKAIMAVIEDASTAYFTSDTVRYASDYLNSEDFTSLTAAKSSYSVHTGWKGTMERRGVSVKRPFTKEIKTPIKIRVYPETAWAVYRNEGFNENGETINVQLRTDFLEKVKGKWRIAYNGVVNELSYCQADNWAIAAISQAKACGKNPEEAGRLAGELFKPSWNQKAGYTGFANTTITNWRYLCMPEGFKILEQDDNHAVISACKSLINLKKSGKMFNVTYDEYLAYYKGIFDVYADFMGGVYKQETIPEGVKIYISKK